MFGGPVFGFEIPDCEGGVCDGCGACQALWSAVYGFRADGFAGHASVYPAHAVPNLFLTNHDVVRFGDLLQRGAISSPDKADYWERHKAALSLLAAYSGPVTLYYGDEIGDELTHCARKTVH